MAEVDAQRPWKVIVVGASAGGVEALTRLTKRIPENFGLPIVVVLHVPPTSSLLPQILTRAGTLPAEHVQDGDALEPGRILIAPPDCHVLVADTSLRVGRGPKENGHRPAVDPLFRTAAAQFGAGAIGVVLSGALDDGTAGLASIKQGGGLTIVQDPSEALYPAMPMSARDVVGPDHILRVEEIADLLVGLTVGPPDSEPSQSREEERAVERDPTQMEPLAITQANREVGELTAFTCPECDGSLWEVREGGLVKLRCRVGHAYTEDGYAHEKTVRLEAALWTALTALVERADFSRRLAERFRRGGHELSAKRYEDEAEGFLEQAETLRHALMSVQTPEPEQERAS